MGFEWVDHPPRHRGPRRSRTSWLRRFGQWLGLIV